jgi:hypothetical protein
MCVYYLSLSMCVLVSGIGGTGSSDETDDIVRSNGGTRPLYWIISLHRYSWQLAILIHRLGHTN